MKSDPSIFSPSVETDSDLFTNWSSDVVKNGYEGDTMPQNEPFYFYIQLDSRLKIDRWQSNMGTISFVGNVEREQVEPLVRLYGKDKNSHVLAWNPNDSPPEFVWFRDEGTPEYALRGRVLTVAEDNCPVSVSIIYRFTAAQYKFTPGNTDLVDQDDQYPASIRFFCFRGVSDVKR